MKKVYSLVFFSMICLQQFDINAINLQTQNTQAVQNIFQIDQPDYKLSPKTGMTRKHWKDAAMYLLKGAFSYVKTLDDPMKFPKQAGISYPLTEAQVPTEKLEGLCRTLFVAAPLLKDNPSLTINNIKVAEYYHHQICNLFNPNSSSFIKARTKEMGPVQNLVEFGALAISLTLVPEVLWDPLTKPQKDSLATLMLSYGDGPSYGNNWKFFNVYVLSFFKDKGYQINEKLLVEYIDKILKNYRAEGWYNDNPAYDYYSMWAFQMYGEIWAHYYGDKYYPEKSNQFKQNFSPLKDNYPYLFSKEGKMIMWGRSMSYRFGSAIPFALMGMENDPRTNYGWMRRIASSTLLQFIQHPEFLKDGIPTLGFYGPFEPAVQMYSCRGSVYWSGKFFLGLFIPENSPFWSATENNGAWDTEFEMGKVYNKFSKGTGILITDYPNIGASEVRAWCNASVASDHQKFRSTENYNRLSYNSAFPWQADGTAGEVAMNYVVKNKVNRWEALRLYTFKKFENGIYYRNVELETNKNIRFKLADIPLANGILRVDKLITQDTVELRLGHYALPALKGKVKEEIRRVKGHEVRIISNEEYQLALVNLSGWEKMETLVTNDLHPQSKVSTIINLSNKFLPNNQKYQIYACLMLWKKAGEKWSEEELMPVKKIETSNKENQVTVIFKNGERKLIDFTESSN